MVPFTWESYGVDKFDPAWTTDKRHLYWMFDFLNVFVWQNTLEIGCLHGTSSVVFVELLKRNRINKAHFCDINITHKLTEVLYSVKERVVVHPCRSVEVLKDNYYDFIWIDGDHSLATVKEELDLISKKMPLTIFAHDTSLALLPRYGSNTEGPAETKLFFQKQLGWYCLEDNKPRSGENTDRGMFFATCSLEYYKVAQKMMEKWM